MALKKLEAIIRPEKLDQVKEALEKAGYYAMTVIEVRGRGEQRGIELQYRGSTVRIDLLPKVKIEIVADEKDIEKIAEIIAETARTGKPGDGRIFILPVEKTIRIRTGEQQT
jgi:nitrogen regulatory protein P-II 1